MSLSYQKNGFGIRDPEKIYSGSRIPDPGSKRAPDPGSGTLRTVHIFQLLATNMEDMMQIKIHIHSPFLIIHNKALHFCYSTRERSHGFEISGWVQKRINASAVGLGIFLDFIPQSRSWRNTMNNKFRLENRAFLLQSYLNRK